MGFEHPIRSYERVKRRRADAWPATLQSRARRPRRRDLPPAAGGEHVYWLRSFRDDGKIDAANRVLTVSRRQSGYGLAWTLNSGVHGLRA